MRRLPPPRVIAVDVDGTLLLDRGRINAPLVESLKAKADDGFDLIVWSMRGRAYAQAAADRCGLDAAVCVGKPGMIIDDCGIDWLRGCTVARRD